MLLITRTCVKKLTCLLLHNLITNLLSVIQLCGKYRKFFKNKKKQTNKQEKLYYFIMFVNKLSVRLVIVVTLFCICLVIVVIIIITKNKLERKRT